MKKFKGLLFFVLLFVSVFFINNISVLAETDTKYLKVNNTTLEFQEIIYVDGTNGNDSSGDGSKESPFKTVTKGFNYLNENCREGGAIVIKEGRYNLGGIIGSSLYSNLNKKYVGMKLSLISETMGKVQLQNCPEWMVIEYSSTSRIKLNMYGIVISSFNNSAANGRDLGGDDWINEYYNCVIPAGYRISLGVPDASIKVENCLFLGSPSSRTKSITGTTINCVSTSNVIEPSKGNVTNCLYNATIDSDYNITSDGWENTGIGTNPDGTVANIGVYGGQFSWGSTVSEIENPSTPINLIATVGDSTITLKWDSLMNAQSYNIKRSTTPDGPFETVATSSAITYTDTGVTPGTTYYYVVGAIVSGEESANSNIASALIKVTPTTNILKIVLEVGEHLQLSVNDDLEVNKEMTWTSSENRVATVDGDGVVTALTSGNTVITVLSVDGTYTDYINVLVVDDASDYRLAVDLKKGKSCRLTVDDLENNVKINWVSLDPTVAITSNKGKVTAVNEGLTVVIARDVNGIEIGQIYIRVRK